MKFLALFLVLFMATPTYISVSDKDNGTTVKVPLHYRMRVGLQATPGTGYSWHVVKQDVGYLKLLGQWEDAGFFGPKPGKPETQWFEFDTLNRGKTELELHYYRSFEQATPMDKTFKIDVMIP